MFRRKRNPPFTGVFEFPINESSLHRFLTAPAACHHWICPVCPWEFHVVAETSEDFERLIENHERETHNV